MLIETQEPERGWYTGAVGWIDDHGGLSAGKRFAMHCAAAAWVFGAPLALTALIEERTAGNPLFIEEVVQALVAQPFDPSQLGAIEKAIRAAGLRMKSNVTLAFEGDAPASVYGNLTLLGATTPWVLIGFIFALGVPIAAGVLYPFVGILLSPLIAAAAMSTVVSSNVAGGICDATNRFQIKR